jgi:DNA repair protein RadC
VPPKKHYHGHRQRLRERFLKNGGESLANYEILELILFGAVRQGDVKPLAKRLLSHFNGLAGVLSAPVGDLAAAGLGESTIAAIKVCETAALQLLRSQVGDGPVLNSWNRLMDYCSAAMAHQNHEVFRVLFLDKKNRLIADEIQQHGTVDHALVYPREVVKRSLELGATALILLHNHPSGDPTPSRADIEVTKQMVEAASALGITVHDHIVIGRGKNASFRGLGLL